jgi:predicted glutamine amidotransferase
LQQQPLLVDAQGSFGEARLLDEDVAIDFQSETTPNDVVTLIATRPLTGNENWVKMVPGSSACSGWASWNMAMQPTC